MPSASMLKSFVDSDRGERKLSNGKTYDPSVAYYSIDWFDHKECRWVRSNFTTLDNFFLNYAISGCSKNNSVFQTANDFRVLSEEFLSLPRKNWNEEIKSYVPDFITNRQFIFDNRYEDYAVLTTLQQSLSQLTADKETKEEWFQRIKSDPRMKSMFLKKNEEVGSSNGEYSHLSIVNGKWVSDKAEEEE